MKDDPLWLDVTDLMVQGTSGLGSLVARLAGQPSLAPRVGEYAGRLARLLGILDVELYAEEITGPDKTIDVVVNIFNRVNSGGTKLSKGDLALAKICSGWPEGRDEMKRHLRRWHDAGFNFDLDWLLRSVNTVLTGEARFLYLHDKGPEEVRDALQRATRHIDTSLNLISSRLGLDHDRVLFGRYAIPVMVRYLDQHKGPLSAVERDKLLFWYVQAGMWGRFSGSTESYLDQDLAAIEDTDGNLDKLIEQARLWHGGLRVEPGHFTGWSLGARFYPVLYMITRMGNARDWFTGMPLHSHMLGHMSRLEVHHIFPKAQLYKRGHNRPEVNALANYCFLTKESNLNIGDRLPEEYFPEVEAHHPGALASQWIPMDRRLWKIENYLEFLEARKVLLAEEVNRRLAELLHGDTRWLASAARPIPIAPVEEVRPTVEEEEKLLTHLNAWMEQHGLPGGYLAYDLADPATGEQKAILDLAWPRGIQQDLSEPVAILLNEDAHAINAASEAGFRCFTDVSAFKSYVEREILAVGE